MSPNSNNPICEKYKPKRKKGKKNLYNTHTLRHVVESNPGGRFPLKIGSICKNKKVKKKNQAKEKKKKKFS